jgi:hypothetical protein
MSESKLFRNKETSLDTQIPTRPDEYPLTLHSTSALAVREALGGTRMIGIDDRKLLQGPDEKPVLDVDKKEMLEGPGETLPLTEEKQPLLPSPEKKPFKIDMRVIDISAVVEQLAHREAEEKVNEYLTSEKTGFFAKIGARLGEPGLRLKFYSEAKEAIINNRNLMASIDARMKGESKTEIAAGSEIKSIKYLDEILATFEDNLTEKEEDGQRVSNPEVDHKVALLLMRYAQGKIVDRTAFDDEVERLIVRPHLSDLDFGTDTGAKNQNNKSKEKGLMFATNLFNQAVGYKEEIHKAVAEAVEEHGKENEKAVAEYISRSLEIDVKLGKKSRDVVNRYPEGSFSYLERAVEGIQSIPVVNKLVNPFTVGIVVSALANMGARKLVTIGAVGATAAFLGPLAAGALAGAAYATVRKSVELKRDRGLEMRRETLGISAGNKKSEKLRESIYEQINGPEAVANLKKMKGGELTAAQRTDLIEIIGALEIERGNQIDLIGVGASEGVDYKTRIFTINELRREIKRIDQEMPNDKKTKESFASDQEAFVAAKLGEIEAKNGEFKSYHHVELLKTAFFGVAIGMAAGAAFRELTEWGGKHLTGAWSKIGAYIMPEKAHVGSTTFHQIPYGNGNIDLPEGVEFVKDAQGNGMFVRSFGLRPLSTVFSLDASGKIPQSAIDELKQHGFNVHEQMQHIGGANLGPLHSEVLNGGAQTFEIPGGHHMQQMPDGTFSITDSHGAVIENGIVVNPDGTLDATSEGIMRSHGWEIKAETFPSTKIIAKGDVLKHFQDQGLAQQHANPIYHGHGTRLSNAGELKLELIGQKGNQDLSVLDLAKSLIRHGAHNVDGTVDNKFGAIAGKILNKNIGDVLDNMHINVYIPPQQPPHGHFVAVALDRVTGTPVWGGLKSLAFDAHNKLIATTEVSIGDHILATAPRTGVPSDFVEHSVKSVMQFDIPDKGIDVVHSVLEEIPQDGAPIPEIIEIPGEINPWAIATSDWVRGAPKRGDGKELSSDDSGTIPPEPGPKTAPRLEGPRAMPRLEGKELKKITKEPSTDLAERLKSALAKKDPKEDLHLKKANVAEKTRARGKTLAEKFEGNRNVVVLNTADGDNGINGIIGRFGPLADPKKPFIIVVDDKFFESVHLTKDDVTGRERYLATRQIVIGKKLKDLNIKYIREDQLGGVSIDKAVANIQKNTAANDNVEMPALKKAA